MLATSGMFEKVDMEGKSNPDRTLGVKILLTESTWQSAERFRCINVGLLQQSKPIEMDDDMTEKEKLEYYRSQEREYRRRMDKARPCLLSPGLNTEIRQMLRDHGKIGKLPYNSTVALSTFKSADFYPRPTISCAKVCRFLSTFYCFGFLPTLASGYLLREMSRINDDVSQSINQENDTSEPPSASSGGGIGYSGRRWSAA
ncbi:Protein TOC75-3, chloroplastic [Linum grandiflorum]